MQVHSSSRFMFFMISPCAIISEGRDKSLGIQKDGVQVSLVGNALARKTPVHTATLSSTGNAADAVLSES